MPRATHDIGLTEEFNLESLEGGVVTLRQMTYGERVKVREMTMQLSMQTTRGRQTNEATIDMEMTQMRVDEYEFSKSIVEHNLTDEADTPLNFKKSGVVASLAPQIGTEISLLIARFNNPEEDPKVAG